MNILYTGSSRNTGGQELQAVAQMAALMRTGHQVTLACREGSGIAAEAARQGIRVEYIPFRNSLHLRSVSLLRKLILRFRPQMVVCHSGHDSHVVWLTRVTLRGRAGRFCIIRQKTYLTRKRRMFSLNHLCDAVVVPSPSMREALVNAGCQRLIAVATPGFDFAALRRAHSLPVPEHIRQWLEERVPAPVIVQTGMLRPEKAHDFMLTVLYQLRREGRRFYWLIAGSGKPEEERRLRNAILHLGMDDCVLMCGLVRPVMPVYQHASLLVLPSRNESFGMVAVEAAACGIPVIASRVGGIPSVIQDGETGTLLPPDDGVAWQHALRAFLDNPAQAQEMAARAEEDLERRFSVYHTVDRLMSLGQLYR